VTSSAPLTSNCNTWLIALLVIGSILWLGCVIEWLAHLSKLALFILPDDHRVVKIPGAVDLAKHVFGPAPKCPLDVLDVPQAEHDRRHRGLAVRKPHQVGTANDLRDLLLED
jgi:hypothetical protein